MSKLVPDMSTNNPVLQWLVDAAPLTIACFIIVFNIFGHFGNANIIIVTIKKKSLQSKHGILLSIACAEQSACLLGELVNAYFAVAGDPIPRNMCLMLMSPYLFIDCMQSMMFLLISLDVLASIIIPMTYKKFNNFNYCFSLSCVPLVFPAVLLSYAWSHITNEQIFLCNPPLALAENGTAILGGVMVAVNFVTLLIYGYIYFRVYVQRKKNKNNNANATSEKNSPEKKIMRSLSILVLVFCFSWVFCMSSVFFIKYATSNQLIIILVQSYAVLFALIAFSQTFYVCYIRSEMYRSEFQEHICGKKRHSNLETQSRSRSKQTRVTTI